MAALRKLWDAFRGVDRRQMQLEIDMHRLFLLTSYNKMKAENDDNTANDVIELSERLSPDERQRAVQENVHKQVVRISQAMDAILLAEQPKSEESCHMKKRVSGLSFAVGQKAPKRENPEMLVPVKTHPLKLAEVSTALKESIGYTLESRPSQIDHKEAGQGVFLAGNVRPGTVVSFYPGIIYSPSQYRYMPGYPRMDINNSYLVSRYDGLIIDGKPWGFGGDSREIWDGTETNVQVECAKDKTGKLWSTLCGAKQTLGARKGAILERRNPLALAHIVNHPVQGQQPNVMLCPYDFVFKEPNIRAYIPNVNFDDHEEKMRRSGIIWVYDKRQYDSEDSVQDNGEFSVIRTLVLVATKEICNEELFLNYRLSNHQKWPAWYQPVDSEEDKRRWN